MLWVAAYIRNNLKFSIISDLTMMEEQIFESFFINLHLENEILVVGTIYRTPDELIASNNTFLNLLDDKLKIINRQKHKCIIHGDMNYDLCDIDSNAEDLFKDTMFTYLFYPLINRPTRITDDTATVIDHIWSNILSNSTTSGILTNKISDHLPVFQITSQLGRFQTTKPPELRLDNKALAELHDKLAIVDIYEILVENDVDVALENLCTIICEAVNSLKPSNRPIPKRPKPKWYDKELKKLKIKQEQSYHRYIENKTIANKLLSNQAKNVFFFTLKKKRNSFFEKKFQKYKKNSKATWKMINKLLGRKKKTTASISLQVGGTFVDEPTEVANIFNSYFANVANDIRSKLPSTNKKFTEYLPSRTHRTAYLFVTTESEIMTIIKKLKRKFSLGLDGISTDILKALPFNIIAAITQIFNQCLTDGYFPYQFKTARIVPIYKKKGSRSKKRKLQASQPPKLLI